MAFNLFPKKKKEQVKSKSQVLEEQKEGLLKELILGYRKKGYNIKQIKKIFTKKGYPAEFVDYLLEKITKEVKSVAKKPVEVEEEDEEEEEEEEDFEEEEEEPVIEPPKKTAVKTKPKANPFAETSKNIVEAENEWKLGMEQAVQTLNARIAGIESALFRAGVLR